MPISWARFSFIAVVLLTVLGVAVSVCYLRWSVGFDLLHTIGSQLAEESLSGGATGRPFGIGGAGLEAPKAGMYASPLRLLSYQPPGNGWNNQRIALEAAMVLAKMLGRELVVHPLSSHEKGEVIKAARHVPGYAAYNSMSGPDLLPLSSFMDLELMSRLVPVREVQTAHPVFLRDYGNLTWRNVCHSVGYGYWVDRLPLTSEEVGDLMQQRFHPNAKWREKCADEQRQAEASGADPQTPIIRFVSNLTSDPSEMLYFEEGTLFGVHIRFMSRRGALDAQGWLLDHFGYNSHVWDAATAVAKQLGEHYNALHVRRIGHIDKKLPQSFWLESMEEQGFDKTLPVYVSTDTTDRSWFEPFANAGYTLYFAESFPSLNLTHMPASLRSDMLGIHEQCICEKAEKFVPSPASTFAVYISRRRGEVPIIDGLMQETVHTFWVKHQLKDPVKS